jgi:general secretion pathway protein D
VVKTYYLANSDAKTVGTTLKTILKTRDIVVDEKLNMLMIRDSPEAIRLADKLVALQDVPEPEVMLEVEILEVKRSRLQALGVNWPDASPCGRCRSTPDAEELGNINSSTTGVTVGRRSSAPTSSTPTSTCWPTRASARATAKRPRS